MKSILLSSVTAAIAALILTTAAFAQYKPVGDDGIAASPKLRQLLNDKLSTPKAEPTMACKKCTDVASAELRPQAKGAEVISQAKLVSFSHSCSSCRTKLSTAGDGKTKHQVATHTCSMDGASSLSCCASK